MNIETLCPCGNIVPEVEPEKEAGLCSACFTWKRVREGRTARDTGAMEQRTARWKDMCPEQYRLNEIEQVPIALRENIMAWRLCPRGLLLHGPSQRGKTTMIWRLLEHLYTIHGIRFEAVSEAEFAEHTSGFSEQEYMKRLSFAPLVFLDDLGHAARSSRFLEKLYLVVERRTNSRRPILATTQFDIGELGGATNKTMQAILNRLVKACLPIQFPP